MSDYFVPDPRYSFGRIDTSAGEGGDFLHKVNPNLFPVGDDGKMAQGAAQDTTTSTPEDIVLQPTTGDSSATGATYNPPAGTVDTTGSEGVTLEHYDQSGDPDAAKDGTVELNDDGTPVEPVEPPSGDQYDAITSVEELRALAKSRDLSAAGGKDTIRERLREADAAVPA